MATTIRTTGLDRFFLKLSVFFLFSSFLVTLPALAADQIVRVGFYEAEPSIFTDPSGKPVGLYVDILEYIAGVEGWQLHYVPGSWAAGLEQLEKGEIDIVSGIVRTAEREKRFAYNKVPIMTTWTQAYVGKGSGIVSLLDLKDKRVAAVAGSVQEEGFIRFSKGFDLRINLIPVRDYEIAFSMVARGEADAALAYNEAGTVYRKRYKLDKAAIMFNALEDYYATTKDDPKRLLETIDRHLATMKDDPMSAYFVSLKRWQPEEDEFIVPTWLLSLGLAVLGLLILSMVGSTILRQQVKARTRELQLINQEMEQRITLRTAELAAAMEKAQAADRIKSAFLAIMSHELRTPLNSIIGFTGILLQGLAGPLNPEQQKQLAMVQNSSRHLLALINDVLDISKIEAGQLVLTCTSFDLRPSVEKMVKLVLPLAEKKGIELRLDLPDIPMMLTTDQRRVEQVVLNLLSNGVKFTEKGQVRISCRLEDEQCILSVADTGIGMRPEELPNLFQPFHQIDTGLARKHEGTGLGLSICKKILDLMGGSIEVASQWGQGSTFTVRFPRQTGGAA